MKQSIVALMIMSLIGFMIVPNVAFADEPAETEQEKQSIGEAFAKAMDEFETVLNDQERLGSYGTLEVLHLADQLEQEFQRNAASLLATQQQDSPLAKRQKHLSLYLWQLKCIGPNLAGNRSSQDMMSTKLHRLLSDHRDAMKDTQLMRRFQALTHRAQQADHAHFLHRMGDNFHFIQPEDADVSQHAAALPNANDPPDANDLPTANKLPVGAIQDAAFGIRQLVHLKWDGGALMLDDEHWSQPFGGKSLSAAFDDSISLLKGDGVEIPDAKARTLQFMKQ
ncbi:hypothetical protein [Stieleria varia]|uniref:Secreted protein n=1 Tax=Stieleria varia TaxID=2528005 RepID=A0A5C6B9X0_9BACT|nr:hypothetical protein [Stieleria varia]TWU08119.1 hypothetical protein Pla52n_07010 [Stieleria varia]